MKKVLSIAILLFFVGNVGLCTTNSNSTKTYKMNQYNSKGQKVGYSKIYYKGDKTNIIKVEKYNTKGKRLETYR